jgi:lipopolysaccharide exporter
VLSEPPDPRLLSASVRRAALWSFANTLLLRLSGILLTAVVAHILDPSDFGVFAVASTVYLIVSAIGEFGVSSCLMRADLDIDSIAPTMTAISVTTGLIQAGAMIVFAEPIAAALGSAQAAGPIRVMALCAIIVGVFAVPSGQLMRDFRQDKLFLAEVAAFVPYASVLLVLAESGNGAMAFAWSRVAGQLISGCIVFASARRHYRPGLAWSALSLLFGFGFPLAVAGIVNSILLNVDYALVGHLLGAVSLGFYVLAFNAASWPASLLFNMISNVSIPAFSRVKHDGDLLKDSITSAVRVISLVIMPISALIVALARPIILVLYGAKWAASADVLSVLSIYGAISIMCVLFANIIAALGRARFLLAIQVFWLAALVPAMALGVGLHGIMGAAVAHIAVIGPLVLPSYLLALKRTAGVRFMTLAGAMVPALVVALAAALAARGVASQFTGPLTQLVMGLAVGGLIYLVAAAPQVMALLNRGSPMELPVGRVLGLIGTAARLISRLGRRRPGHSPDTSHPARSTRRCAQQGAGHTAESLAGPVRCARRRRYGNGGGQANPSARHTACRGRNGRALVRRQP